MRIRLIGTGASMGVPVVGCNCPVCRSPDPRNRRLRSSAFIETLGKRWLIDCGPDIRQQALESGVSSLDGVLVTHAHMDHMAGLDDLRPFFSREKELPLVAHESTGPLLQRGGAYYLFQPRENGIPRLALETVSGEQGKLSLLGEEISWIRYWQVETSVLGFRIGPFAYVTDLKGPPSNMGSWLEGVEILVLSALQLGSHPYFLSLSEAVEYAQQWRVPQTILTHLSHEIDAIALATSLPPEVSFGYDGMVLRVRRF